MRYHVLLILLFWSLPGKAGACEVLVSNHSSLPLVFTATDASTKAPLMADTMKIPPHQEREVDLQDKCGKELLVLYKIGSGPQETAVVFPEGKENGRSVYILP